MHATLDMIAQSLWRATTMPRFAARDIPPQVDDVVVGAGITGLTAAYLLKRAGRNVAVFEREKVGSGETGNTSAHLTYVTDADFAELEKRFGAPAARSIWRGGAAAIELIEQIVDECGIQCGFTRVPGFRCAPFVLDGPAGDTSTLRDEAARVQSNGFDARYLEHGPVTGRPAVGFADQALFHPLRYLHGIAAALDGDGSVVCDMAEVGATIENPRAVIVNGKTIACENIIIATHVPIVGNTGLVSASLLQTKLYPYSSYVIGARVGNDSPPPGLYSDTADPYYYLRIHERPDGRYAILGGEDHKTGQVSDTDTRYAKLQDLMRTLIPSAKIERRWTGQIVETSDGLPFVGETAEHQFAATGYAGNGLTFGTLSAMMIRDAIVGRANPLHELFDPHRKPHSAGAVARLVTENVDYPFYMIGDRVRASIAHDDASSVGPGEGKVITIDGKRVACHRTQAGTVIKVSASCTHLGCLVRWNHSDATWDCPCHGSRFTPEGLVLGGPAEAPLERLND